MPEEPQALQEGGEVVVADPDPAQASEEEVVEEEEGTTPTMTTPTPRHRILGQVGHKDKTNRPHQPNLIAAVEVGDLASGQGWPPVLQGLTWPGTVASNSCIKTPIPGSGEEGTTTGVPGEAGENQVVGLVVEEEEALQDLGAPVAVAYGTRVQGLDQQPVVK